MIGCGEVGQIWAGADHLVKILIETNLDLMGIADQPQCSLEQESASLFPVSCQITFVCLVVLGRLDRPESFLRPFKISYSIKTYQKISKEISL